MTKFLIFSFTLILIINCSNKKKNTEKLIINIPTEVAPPLIYYSLIKTLPHDTTSYTQGLLIHNGQFFESTGSPIDQKQTKSVFGILDTTSGKIDIKAELDRNKYFGEGIVIIKNRVFQLTWQNQIGFIYDAKTFKPLGQFSFANKEGWGLTTDGTFIIMSDGTNILTYLDPKTLKVIKTINVMNNSNPENYLNELEYIKGFIYANVYQSNNIVKIDPKNGKVVGFLDLSYLEDKAKNKYYGSEVLNGIAFDSIANKIYVTGKLWPEIYQIDFFH
ncbi:MAG: glutaminyl-peptide cyclotransferase [Cytophagales bacterium]|nr:MAG: glutaminyl-peptide cyclotransferase [Cytophagales bacterium]